MIAKNSAGECFSVYSEDFAGSDQNPAGKDSEASRDNLVPIASNRDLHG
jgi:hypothetical protein